MAMTANNALCTLDLSVVLGPLAVLASLPQEPANPANEGSSQEPPERRTDKGTGNECEDAACDCSDSHTAE